MLQRVPTHVRNLQLRRKPVETDYFSGDDAQSFVIPTFVARIEQQLQPKADSQERTAPAYELTDGRNDVSHFQFVHRVTERTDAGQDQLLGGGDLFWIARDPRLRADPFERFLNATQVAHLVVNDRNHL